MSTPGLNPRSMLFTLYGDYAHRLGRPEVRVGALVRLAGELGVSDGALRSALSRMTREGWLESRGGRYALSERGRRLIEEGTRRIYGTSRSPWDGRWLLVSYSLPERRRGQRDRLRQGLSFLGFGSLGNGLFVSPHDLRGEVLELIRRSRAERDVTVHHGRLEWPDQAAQVVARAWDLKHLEARYRAFEAAVRRELDPRSLAPPPEAFRRRFLLTHEFRRFPFSDPDLPEPLLPPDWAGTSAREAFLTCHGRLRRGAEKHYLAIASDNTIVDDDERRRRGPREVAQDGEH